MICDQASFIVLALMFSHKSLFRPCSGLMWAHAELEMVQSQLRSDFSRLTNLAEGLS